MRKIPLIVASVSVAMLSACATTTMPSYGSNYPSTYPVSTAPVAGVEYGRITNIEYLPAGTHSPLGGGGSILGAVVGGLVGGALGNQIGSGSGRTAATVLGAVGGAALGNQIARNQQGVTTAPGYRITMQTDQGYVRTYEVPATGDLRVGDRVRVDGGVIYRG